MNCGNRLQAQLALNEQREETSGDNEALTLTLQRPGSDRALVLMSARAFYSDGQTESVTVTYRDRGGTERTFTIRTGSGIGPTFTAFLPPGDGGLVTEENSEITIEAPAGGAGVTSTIRAVFSIVDNGLIEKALEHNDG